MRRNGASAFRAVFQFRRVPPVGRLARLSLHLRNLAFGNCHGEILSLRRVGPGSWFYVVSGVFAFSGARVQLFQDFPDIFPGGLLLRIPGSRPELTGARNHAFPRRIGLFTVRIVRKIEQNIFPQAVRQVLDSGFFHLVNEAVALEADGHGEELEAADAAQLESGFDPALEQELRMLDPGVERVYQGGGCPGLLGIEFEDIPLFAALAEEALFENVAYVDFHRETGWRIQEAGGNFRASAAAAAGGTKAEISP